MGPQGPGAGVTGGEGLLGQAAHIPKALVVQVGHVGDHPQGFHLRQKLRPLLLQAPGLAVGEAQLVLVVPGEGEHPHPQPVEGAEVFHISLAHAPLLHGEDGGDLAIRPGLFQVGEGPAGGHQIPVFLHLAGVQLRQGENGPPGVGLLRQVHKECEVLQEVAALLQFFQVDVHGLRVPEVHGLPPAAVVAEPGDGIAVQVGKGHGSYSFLTIKPV